MCIYIYTYMHALHCIALHYIPRQFSNVHYSTLHYIHYLTLPYLTLHYITLHIYLSLCAYGAQKKMCSNCVRYVAVIFLYTHFECLLYSHVLLIFISRGEHVHGIQTYTYMYDLKTLRNTIILLQPSQHTITQTKKNKNIYIYI